jgi:DNA-binding NarL/FixJ family response regulator
MVKRPLILLVDDNPNFVDRLLVLLEESGSVSDISIANDYEEALSLYDQDKPAMALLDINLPGKSGIELLRFFKKDNREVEVIMISNHTDDYYKDLCMRLGARCILDKSNDLELLTSIIRGNGC